MRFKAAVEATDSIAAAYRAGLQAVPGVDRARMTVNDTARLGGSVNLDAALSGAQPNAPRWDYGVGWKMSNARDNVIWIEVHPASTSNVKEMVAKVDWLRLWLRDDAPDLDRLTRRKPAFVWIASGAVHIPKNSPQFRRLAGAGIRYPCKHLTIDTC